MGSCSRWREHEETDVVKYGRKKKEHLGVKEGRMSERKADLRKGIE